MSKKDIIKEITIEIAGTEVSVTPQQARNLHEALTELLGLSQPPQKIVEHVYRDRWYPYWTWGSSSIGGTTVDNTWTVSYQGSTGSANLSVT
jgi:hypothetical protein